MKFDPAFLLYPEHQLPNCETTGIALSWPCLGGVVYWFHRPGDAIPAHTHEFEAQRHLTIVTRGSISYRAAGAAPQLLEAGDVLVVPSKIEHSFIGVSPSSVCINLRFAGLAASELASDLEALDAHAARVFAKVAGIKALTENRPRGVFARLFG